MQSRHKSSYQSPKAINITMREPNILLHDGRAASLEKLSRLQEALNDGKRMVQLKPESAKVFVDID